MQDLNSIEIEEVSGGCIAVVGVLAFCWYNLDNIKSVFEGFAAATAEHNR